MLILIWLVQIIIYPAYHRIDKSLFTAWHRSYVRYISFFVIPLMLIQAGGAALRVIAGWSVLTGVYAGTITAAWIVTFAISAPCHQRLQRMGRDTATIDRLIRTNWVRTIAWTLAWICTLINPFPMP